MFPLQDPFVRFQHRLDPWWNQFWCFVMPAIYAHYKYNDFWSGFFVLGGQHKHPHKDLRSIFLECPCQRAHAVFYFPMLFVLLCTAGCLRWCICLHATWTVNSTAHIWGDRRYTVEGNPCESCFTALVAVGEGWHDWHHKYPYDYAASEGGIFDQYNPSKLVSHGMKIAS